MDSAPGGRRPVRSNREWDCSRRRGQGRAKDWERALAATPTVRMSAVIRARHLIANPAYPPPEIIAKIAATLAAPLTAGHNPIGA